MCEAGPFAGQRGLGCFAREDERRNPGQDPGHQRTKNRGAGENCKAVANRLRKTRRAPVERTHLTPVPGHVKRLSNASFETKHRPLAAFPGSLSFAKRRRSKMIWREQNHANCREIKSSRKLIHSSMLFVVAGASNGMILVWWQPFRLRWEFGRLLHLGECRQTRLPLQLRAREMRATHRPLPLRSVLGEKLALARIGVRGHAVPCLEARLAQPGGSVFALLLRDGAYAQGCKGYCYSRCHFRFDG
jgi:hypothetical protein